MAKNKFKKVALGDVAGLERALAVQAENNAKSELQAQAAEAQAEADRNAELDGRARRLRKQIINALNDGLTSLALTFYDVADKKVLGRVINPSKLRAQIIRRIDDDRAEITKVGDLVKDGVVCSHCLRKVVALAAGLNNPTKLVALIQEKTSKVRRSWCDTDRPFARLIVQLGNQGFDFWDTDNLIAKIEWVDVDPKQVVSKIADQLSKIVKIDYDSVEKTIKSVCAGLAADTKAA